MERKIGEIFKDGNVLIKTVEEKGACNNCYYGGKSLCYDGHKDQFQGECVSYKRTDKIGVIFKEIKTMKKSDLKPGMVIECRDGDRLIMLNNEVAYGIDVYMDLDRHNDDLTSKDWKSNDVVKVYGVPDDTKSTLTQLLEHDSDYPLNLVWERTDEIVLTIDEIAEKFGVDPKNVKIKK